MVKAVARESGTGSVSQLHGPKWGCPEPVEVVGANGRPKKVRPDHTCKGPWRAVVELPGHGTERRRKPIQRRTREAALAALRQARRDLERAGDLPTANPTLATWLDQWITRAERDRLKPRTAHGYRGNITRYLVPELGKVRLDKLTAQHVQRLHDTMLAKGLSTTTVNQAHRVLSKALTDAERAGLVTRNVAPLAPPPGAAYAPRPALTADQARTLLLSAAGTPSLAAHWSVALLAGLRQGERLGLTWDSVDLDAGIITVDHQVQRLIWRHGCPTKSPCGKRRGADCPDRRLPVPADQQATRLHGGLWLTEPKSRAGARQVPICEPLAAVLGTYRAVVTPTPTSTGLVFTTGRRPVDPAQDLQAWTDSLATAGLPHVPLHSARHTCSTLLFELGVDELTREAILGHSSAAVNRRYTHVATPQMADAMRRLGELVAAPQR